MEVIELVLLVLVAVLFSSVLDRVIPRLSAPLIQIALGLLVAYFFIPALPFSLDPEFFLFLFIAPLLFKDAKEADRAALWTHLGKIISLAVGLVFAIMLVVGSSLHLLQSAIPLAAAFALGAALGPTDAVAVSSLKRTVHMSRRENALLSGEALINDASGVVAFEFAIAAAVTDTYEVGEAVVDFVQLFFGGIIVGLVMAWLIRLIRTKVAQMGLESNTFYVLIDVLTPWIIYLAAEMTCTSGILAVVAAGLMLGRDEERRIGPSIARMNIVTASTWELLSFVLNGIIFVILGMQLCWIAPRMLGDNALNGGLAGTVITILAITAVLIGIRFVWLLVMEHWKRDSETGQRPPFTKDAIVSALAMTIGGPKGAVTLSIIMSTPYVVASGASFPYRDQIIFIASGVIVLTLLLANFLLPILAPKPKIQGDDAEAKDRIRVDILRIVIRQLSEDMTEKSAPATRQVIRMYNDRIQRIGVIDEDKNEQIQRQLSVDIIKHQEEYLFELMDSGKIDPVVGYRYAHRISQREHILMHRSGLGWFFKVVAHNIRRAGQASIRWLRDRLPGIDQSEQDAALNEVEIMVMEDTVDYLEGLLNGQTSGFPPEVLGAAQARYARAAANLKRRRPSLTYITRLDESLDDVMRRGYYLELQEIARRYEDNDISRPFAKELRENVYLMQIDLEDSL